MAAGLGLSLLPSLAIGVRGDVVLRPLHAGPVRRVRVAFPSGAFRSAAATALVGVLGELAPSAPSTGRASAITDARPSRWPTPR